MNRELRWRSAELAGRGEWAEVDGLLSKAAAKVVLGSRELAYRRGEALYHLGRMEELAEHGAGFEESARERADLPGVMEALNLQGIAAFELGRTGEARDRFEALMELSQSENNLEMLARAANNMGALSNLEGHPHRALSHYRLALALYQRLGQVRGLAQLHHNVGITFRDLSLLQDSLEEYQRCSELAQEIDYPLLCVLSTVGRAEVELRRGDAALGSRLAERGVRDARELKDPISQAEALRVRALAHGGYPGSDHIEAALEDLEEARSLARETGSRLVHAEVERDTAELLARRGEIEAARERLDHAARLFDRLGAEAARRAVRQRMAAL